MSALCLSGVFSFDIENLEIILSLYPFDKILIYFYFGHKRQENLEFLRALYSVFFLSICCYRF